MIILKKIHFPDNGRIYVRRDQRDILYYWAHLPLHHNTKVYFTLMPCYFRRKLTKKTKLLLLDYVQQDLHVEICPQKISTKIKVQLSSKSGWYGRTILKEK